MNNSGSFEPQNQGDECLKRRIWQERRLSAIDHNHHHQISQSSFYNNTTRSLETPILLPSPCTTFMPNNNINSSSNNNNNNHLMKNFHVPAAVSSRGCFAGDNDLVLSTTMNIPPPAVTVVLEGRSICHRINLHKHASYQSLAKALRQMFVVVDDDSTTANSVDHLDLSNAIPGHLIAYEDIENDLLLAGDLNWKDFVRVAKRIRIVPAKTNSRKGRLN